jgi:hypothetical protein
MQFPKATPMFHRQDAKPAKKDEHQDWMIKNNHLL